MTRMGARSAISRQFRQRWNWLEIVGAHDPDEAHFRRAPPQPGDRIIGVARADFRLEPGHGDARVVGQQTRRRDAVAHFLQFGRGFHRIAGGGQPPEPIQAHTPQREFGYEPMPFVRRIERAAEQADGLTGREAGEPYEGAWRRRPRPGAFARLIVLARRHLDPNLPLRRHLRAFPASRRQFAAWSASNWACRSAASASMTSSSPSPSISRSSE